MPRREGIEKSILLQTLDHHWKEHLSTLDALRQVVFLRAYAQKQPINKYKQEAFALFERMLSNIREDVTRTVARIDLRFEEPEPMPLPDLPDFLTTHIDPFTGEERKRRHRCRRAGRDREHAAADARRRSPTCPKARIRTPSWRSAATRRARAARAQVQALPRRDLIEPIVAPAKAGAAGQVAQGRRRPPPFAGGDGCLITLLQPSWQAPSSPQLSSSAPPSSCPSPAPLLRARRSARSPPP